MGQQFGLSQAPQSLPSQAAPNGYYQDSGAGTAMGDVTGDGYDDMLFTFKELLSGGLGSVLGTGILDGKTGAFLPGHRHIAPISSWANWGKAMCVIGDLDGDGLAEYAISNGHRSVYVYWGDPSYGVFGDNLVCKILQVEGSTHNHSNFVTKFGSSLSPGGDLDGDGIPDLLIGDWQVSVGAGNEFARDGAVYLISGYELTKAYKSAAPTPSIEPEIASTTNIGRISQNRSVTGVRYLGGKVFGGMDATGDGFPDILVKAKEIDYVQNSQAPTRAGVLFFDGRSRSRPIHTFVAPTTIQTLGGPIDYDDVQDQKQSFGSSISFMLDVEGLPGIDQDSEIAYAEADVLIGDTGTPYNSSGPSGDPGFVFVFSSANAALLEVQMGKTSVVGGADTGSGMGSGVASAGDVDGDGKGDYFVSEFRWREPGVQWYQQSGTGQVFLVKGGHFSALTANASLRLDSETGSSPVAQYGVKFASSGAKRVYIPGSSLLAPGFLTFSNETGLYGGLFSLGSIEYH